jgi:hypothetical protein
MYIKSYFGSIMISAGISSGLFIAVPFLFRLPVNVCQRMNILALCSSSYHMYEENRQLTQTSKTTLTTAMECLDGMAIILCAGGYSLDANTVDSLIHMYVSMKMVSNNEFIKRAVYFLAVVTAIKNTPRVFIPWITGSFGLYNYFQSGERWNHQNRTIWHLGNSIFIGISYLYKV